MQRALALTALIMLVLLQLFGAGWHQSVHAAEHDSPVSGLQLAMEDHAEELHRHADHSRDDGNGLGHQLHHALHCASHLFEHIQLSDATSLHGRADASQPYRFSITARLAGGVVDPIVPPPNA